jgi:transcriptional regulator NrdR family protein
VKKKELLLMLDYTGKIAMERFASVYDLFEVQTAINALEFGI